MTEERREEKVRRGRRHNLDTRTKRENGRVGRGGWKEGASEEEEGGKRARGPAAGHGAMTITARDNGSSAA